MPWWEIVGWTGSAILVWSLLQTAILRLRLVNLVGSLVLIAYNLAARVWPMVGLNVVLAAINLVQLRVLLRSRHDATAYEVVEVGIDDQYLAHLLHVHRADIARFNPTFQWPAAGPDHAAFVVLRADETVGVLLIRALPGGVAQVVLDYVTPKFRDFTPGEFLFRGSAVLAERGFTRVVTPPAMVAPYYERLGFSREGDHFVLEVTGDPHAAAPSTHGQ